MLVVNVLSSRILEDGWREELFLLVGGTWSEEADRECVYQLLEKGEPLDANPDKIHRAFGRWRFPLWKNFRGGGLKCKVLFHEGTFAEITSLDNLFLAGKITARASEAKGMLSNLNFVAKIIYSSYTKT